MPSLFERALGEDWADLHPRIRERYGVVAAEDCEVVGQGTMAELRRHPLGIPAFWLATRDDFLFPEAGSAVDFTVRTEAFVDDNGLQALFIERRFETEPPRTFADTLRWNPERECIADLLGRRGVVVSDLHLGVDDGDLTLDLGAQWFRLGSRYVGLPGPLAATGTLRDTFDDSTDRYGVQASIRARPLGEVFGYRGTFESERRPLEAAETATDSDLAGIALPDGDG